MIVRLKILYALTRPAVIILFALVTALGVAQGGKVGDTLTLAAALVPVMAFLLFAVTVNDLSDEAVDRVNLPGDRHRPLVSGVGTRQDMVLVAIVAAVLAELSAARLGLATFGVLTAGVVFAAAYSLPPVRLSKRGIVASLTLPIGYVATPFLVGVLAARGSVGGSDLIVLAGLYIAFIGRLVLKDFRDVRGDTLFGKRTFLVRRGRGAACVVAAIAWTTGTVILAVSAADAPAYGVLAAYTGAVLGLLWLLARSASARRDEAIISAIAILGRGTLVSLLTVPSLVAIGWTGSGAIAVMVAIAVVILGQAQHMVRIGPASRLVVPPEFGWADRSIETDAAVDRGRSSDPIVDAHLVHAAR